MNTDSHRTSTLAHIVAGYASEKLLAHPDVDAKYEEEVSIYAARAVATKRFNERVDEANELLAAGDEDVANEQIVDGLTHAEAAGINSESDVNRLGYSLLEQNACDTAIAVFQFNADTHPQSANPYDSLGEAYEACGRCDEARESYASACAHAEAQGDENLQLFLKNLERATAMSEPSR